MPLLADRVKETTNTTGTGALTLLGAATGFQSFTAAFGNAVSVYYVITGNGDWEVGIGTTGTNVLSRDTVLQSSNADALVNWGAGVKDVFCAYVADRAVTTSDAATLTNKTIDDISNFVGANQLHLKVKATATLGKGTICKVVGWNAGEDALEIAAISSATDVAIGILDTALTNGALGTVVNTGFLEGLNTIAFAPGTILYPNASGGLTSTKPSSGTYQAVALVLRQHANQGTLLVEFTNPQYIEASTNTANTLVLRDGSGNFSAGTITAALTGNVTGNVSGNAGTATALQTARTINGVSFDGTGNITVTADAGTLTGSTLASGVTGSSLTSVGTLTSGAIGTGFTAIPNTALANSSVTVNGNSVSLGGSTTVTANTTNALTLGSGLTGTSFNGSAAVTATVDATSTNTASKIVARDASGNFAAGTITAALTGNASTSTALSSSRTFALTGDITGSVSSDLTSGASISTAIAAGVIVDADINASAAIADTKLATISTAGKVANSATTATAASTASTIALRNASGQTAVKGLLVDGTSSGTVTVQGAAAAGTWSLTLPTTAGTNGQALTTNGSGVTSWSSVGGTTTNALTINNSGSGAASGATFNGSSAVTVSYNTVGAPSTTGTNASGTWGISVSGNAGGLVSQALLAAYKETYNTPSIAGGGLSIDVTTGSVFRVARNANITTVTINPLVAPNQAQSFTLIFDANGTSYTITWPASVKWPGGTAPTITTTNGRSDMFVFYSNNSGTTWYAMTAAQNFVTT